MSYLPARRRPLPTAMSSVVRYRGMGAIPDRDTNRSRPTRMAAAMGACCSACAHGRPCSGGPAGPFGLSSMGDTVTDASAQLLPAVQSIQQSAQQYVKNDLLYRKLQVAATLAIPLAAVITKAILHIRRGIPLL